MDSFMRRPGWTTLTELKSDYSLILSLTSHPPRFPFLLSQLKRLANQTLFPDVLVLNIAKEDSWAIPIEVAELDLPFTFEINLVENLGPGTKLIPTIVKYPSATIITIDDDINYPDNLIEALWQESKLYPDVIIGSRAHRPLFISGKLAPYLAWEFEITQTLNHLVFPTGSGGILYPAGSLDKEVLNLEAYKEMSWSTDDIWFWIHAIRAGTQIRKSAFSYKTETTGFVKNSALSEKGNREIVNDLNLYLLWEAYDMEVLLKTYVQDKNLIIRQIQEKNIIESEFFFVHRFVRDHNLMNLMLSLPSKYRSVYAEIVVVLSRRIRIIEINRLSIRINITLIIKNTLRKLKKRNFLW